MRMGVYMLNTFGLDPRGVVEPPKRLAKRLRRGCIRSRKIAPPTVDCRVRARHAKRLGRFGQRLRIQEAAWR